MAAVKARELEARLERVEQQLRLFQRVSRLMTRDIELDGVLYEIVTLVRDYLRCDSALISLYRQGKAAAERRFDWMGSARTKIARDLA